MLVNGSVVREKSKPLGTPGSMRLDNGFSCDTLELPWHNNERGKSCTLADSYHGTVWHSPMLKRLVIRLDDKNGRRDCLVHNGNFAADEADIDGDGASEVTQVHGCTEVGRGYGSIMRKDGKMQWGILGSGKTLQELIDSLRDEPRPVVVMPDGFAKGFNSVLLVYSWKEGCAP
jgi:hypothetical protein